MGIKSIFNAASYEYDASLVTEEKLGGTLNLNLGYQYNDDFALKSLVYAGSTVNYAYVVTFRRNLFTGFIAMTTVMFWTKEGSE